MGKTELIKGSTEVILLTLLNDKEMYGYELAQRIEEDTEGFLTFKEGTLYPALKRLELHDLVESYWKDSNEGPRRKYYKITPSGKSSLTDLKKDWFQFQKIMNRIVGDSIG
ncbi:lineage-specific thermal regulator protein [compost metagenome]